MATYAQVPAGAVKPAGEFTIRPCDWADAVKPKPVTAVKVGLRLPSESDENHARKRARERIEKLHEEPGRAMRLCAVGVAVCDPNDATQVHEAIQAGDEQLADELRPEVITAMFDELERLSVASSPIRIAADDDEVYALARALADNELQVIESIDPAKGERIRRFLRFVLDELTEE